MDLNADGITDVLSGSYAPTKGDEGVMAGTFYVLWGSAEGFSAAEPLLGSDGERLMLPQAESKPRVDQNRICTRPTAVDLNGDGELDLVSGNFKGTFAVFAGEGEGRFAPAASWLLGPDGAQRPLLRRLGRGRRPGPAERHGRGRRAPGPQHRNAGGRGVRRPRRGGAPAPAAPLPRTDRARRRQS